MIHMILLLKTCPMFMKGSVCRTGLRGRTEEGGEKGGDVSEVECSWI